MEQETRGVCEGFYTKEGMSDVHFGEGVDLLTCWVGGRETWMIKEPVEAHE